VPFVEFQRAYAEPKRRVGVEKACRAYVGRISDQPGEHERLMEGLGRWLTSEQWVRSLREDGGQFVLSMERFIADGRYLEYPASVQGEASGSISVQEYEATLRAGR
jgi:hypothetical protein